MTGKVKMAIIRFHLMVNDIPKTQNNNKLIIVNESISPPNENGANGIGQDEETDEEIDSGFDESSRRNPKARKWSQVTALLPVYLLQICYGMNSGYPAILTPQLQEECCSEFHISENEESSIVSIDNLATPLICILSGCLQQKLGPLKVLMFACIPYTLGWLTASVASSVYHLYFSRLLVGTSHALLTTTIYTVEIASIDMRGTFSLMESVLRCLGCLLIYTLGYALRWKTIAIFAPIIPLSALFICFFVPESPVFLMKKHKVKETERVLRRLYGPDYDVKEEISIISENLENLRNTKTRKSSYVRKLSSHPEVYKPFLIILALSVIQQFSGMSVIRAYVVKIFNRVFSPNTRTTSKEAYLSAIAIGSVRLLASLLLSKLLRSYRRRILYFCSCGLTIVFLFVFATCDFLDSTKATNSDVVKWTSVVSSCALVFSVQLGVQTLPNLLSGELFPSDVRAFCKGLTRAITCLFLVGSLKTFPYLQSHIGVYGTFYFFGIILFMCLPFVYWILPETKDIGLELIQNYFTPQKTVFYLPILPKENKNSINNETSETS